MSKLGYTWYPKDWGTSESVFELSLSERGLYREFIDLAMLNDNTTEIKKDVWVRKFCVSDNELNIILDKLLVLNLIEINENILFIPSCENRLKLVRGGSNGGKKSKPTHKPNSKPTHKPNSKPTHKPNSKPTHKPFESLNENNVKPTSKQREIETKIETKIENNINSFFESLESGLFLEDIARNNKFTIDQVKKKLIDFRNVAELEYPNYSKFVSHFKNWIKLNPPTNNEPKFVC
jgi:hypothetical protein